MRFFYRNKWLTEMLREHLFAILAILTCNVILPITEPYAEAWRIFFLATLTVMPMALAMWYMDWVHGPEDIDIEPVLRALLIILTGFVMCVYGFLLLEFNHTHTQEKINLGVEMLAGGMGLIKISSLKVALDHWV